MGRRRISIKESVANSIAQVAWYIESKGLVNTAEFFADEVYDFISKIADTRRRYALCRDPQRQLLGYKCLSYKKKYTIVFLETENELIVCEFIPSKNIKW